MFINFGFFIVATHQRFCLILFMLKVGLTGGIGSGKTTVARLFMLLGIPVFNADQEAKRIMNENASLREKLVGLFGEESYVNNSLNRKYIADIVFKDPYKLELLNAAVHPVTIAAGNAWAMLQQTPYSIKEAAILFETPAAAHLDYIIGVSAPPNIRLQRVMHRDGVPPDVVLARMRQQMDEDIKMKLCDFVIINDEQRLVIPQVLMLHKKLLAIAG